MDLKEEENVMNILKKVLKWIGIVVAGLIVLLIIAALVIPHFLPLDKIKNLAAQKASEAIHRQVKIGKVSFNIFTGIELDNLSVSNRPGFSKEPFVSCGQIVLKYDFWALFQGRVAVSKVVLEKPQILVETKDGVSNYADLVGVQKPASAKASAGKPAAKANEPISLLVSNFSIVDGQLTMNTFTKGAKETMQLKGLNVSLSNISLVTKKPMTLYVGVTGVYEGNPVPITISGNIDLDLSKMYARLYNLDVVAAGDKLSFDITATNFDKAPNIKMSVTSSKINTDKFLAIVSGTGAKKPAPLPYGVQTANMNKSMKSIPSNITLAATFDINNVLFKQMKLNSIKGKASMSKKVLNISLTGINAYNGTITGNVIADLNVSGISYKVNGIAGKGFDATPASNDFIKSFLTKMPSYKDLKDKVYGTLSFGLTLTGKGIETPDIMANAKGSGSFLLANGKISKIESLAAVGEKIGLQTLSKDIDLKEFKANFTIANKIATIKGLTLNNGDAGDVKIGFDGAANIESLAFIKGNTLSLKLNPATTKLSADYDAFKDAQGWYSLDFEMTGSLKKPIPIPKMGNVVNQVVNNKTKELQNAAQKEIDKQKAAAEDKAKQELENKAKEMLHF